MGEVKRPVATTGVRRKLPTVKTTIAPHRISTDAEIMLSPLYEVVVISILLLKWCLPILTLVYKSIFP